MAHPAARPTGVTVLPDRTPGAIRAALATYADPGVAEGFTAAWTAATDAAREELALEPITLCLDKWWHLAVSWQRDPAGYRTFLARMDRYLDEGPPPPERRVTADQFKARYGL